MKNLKFRAYNNATDKMTDWEFIRKVKNLNKLMTLNHVDVMQFTGLKDCDGKEIYEGDLLVDIDVELEEGLKLEDTTEQVYWCEIFGSWNLDNTYSQNMKSGTNLAQDLRDFKFRVIGNKYQNK